MPRGVPRTMITIQERCVEHHTQILLTPHGKQVTITTTTTDRRIEMEWKTKVVKRKRIKVTLDEKFGMYRFGKWYTVIDLTNNNKIVRHCRSYQEVEELLLKTGDN